MSDSVLAEEKWEGCLHPEHFSLGDRALCRLNLLNCLTALGMDAVCINGLVLITLVLIHRADIQRGQIEITDRFHGEMPIPGPVKLS